MKFFHLSVRLTNEKPVAFVCPFDKPIKSLYFRSCVVSVLFARFHFKVIRKSLYQLEKIAGLFMSCVVVWPNVRESNSVSDLGFHAMDSGFPIPDSRYSFRLLCQWNLDFGFVQPPK